MCPIIKSHFTGVTKVTEMNTEEVGLCYSGYRKLGEILVEIVQT